MSAVLKSVPKRRQNVINVSISTYIDTDVDVDLADIDIGDLLEELAQRDGYHDGGLMPIYEAMACGRHLLALELMRVHIQNVTGRVLP